LAVSKGQPRVWCLLGGKAGDNAQVRALAGELGYTREEKTILARPWELLVHLGSRATLAGIDRGNSSSLEPPWPDLVITAGRRNEPVARWIGQQSGGGARLVHIGRPWAPPADYDLVVTTPQYFLPDGDNIVRNSLPLSRPTPPAAAGSARSFPAAIQYSRKPRIAVLCGGDSGKFVFTPGKGASLGRAAKALARSWGGSLLVTDSPRTPKAAGDALEAELGDIDYCYRWGSGEENPYPALLSAADAFVVTGESMSMLGEALETGRPLYIFDIGDGDRRWFLRPHNYRYKPLSHRLAMALGPKRMRRDVSRIQAALVASGRATWLEDSGRRYPVIKLAEGRPVDTGPPPQREELANTAAAVRRLLTAR